jgi:hypothetical protein
MHEASVGGLLHHPEKKRYDACLMLRLPAEHIRMPELPCVQLLRQLRYTNALQLFGAF